MREFRTSGSVGAPGRQRPGATRPSLCSGFAASRFAQFGQSEGVCKDGFCAIQETSCATGPIRGVDLASSPEFTDSKETLNPIDAYSYATYPIVRGLTLARATDPANEARIGKASERSSLDGDAIHVD
jgi:hypothetical protein